jgi:hypothetical protein
VPAASLRTPACPVATFGLSASPSNITALLASAVSISDPSNIRVNPQLGFTSPVTLSVTQVCKGAVCAIPTSCSAGVCTMASTSPVLPSAEFSFSRASLTSGQYSLGSLLRARLVGDVPEATYGLTIRGSGGSQVASTLVTLLTALDEGDVGEQ